MYYGVIWHHSIKTQRDEPIGSPRLKFDTLITAQGLELVGNHDAAYNGVVLKGLIHAVLGVILKL